MNGGTKAIVPAAREDDARVGCLRSGSRVADCREERTVGVAKSVDASNPDASRSPTVGAREGALLEPAAYMSPGTGAS